MKQSTFFQTMTLGPNVTKVLQKYSELCLKLITQCVFELCRQFLWPDQILPSVVDDRLQFVLLMIVIFTLLCYITIKHV